MHLHAAYGQAIQYTRSLRLQLCVMFLAVYPLSPCRRAVSVRHTFARLAIAPISESRCLRHARWKHQGSQNLSSSSTCRVRTTMQKHSSEAQDKACVRIDQQTDEVSFAKKSAFRVVLAEASAIPSPSASAEVASRGGYIATTRTHANARQSKGDHLVGSSYSFI